MVGWILAIVGLLIKPQPVTFLLLLIVENSCYCFLTFYDGASMLRRCELVA